MVVRRYREPQTPSRRQDRPRRRGQLRLFLPSVALGVLFVGLSAFWLYASWRVRGEIDRWLAAEAEAGRTWTCPDRAVGGYPFRIEVTCTNPTFTGRTEGRDVTGSLSRIVAVAQIYAPNHVIVEAKGPLVMRDGAGGELDLDWQLMQASLMTRPAQALERFSMVLTEPTARIAWPGLGETRVAAATADLHLRPTPNQDADHAYDVASRITKATIPPLDAALGNPDPTDADVLATVTRADAARGGGLPDEIERWRRAGGVLKLGKVVVAKGQKRLDAAGSLHVDEERRAAGRLDVSISGLDEVLQSLGLGPRTAALGGLIAGVLGGGKAKATQPQAEGEGTQAPSKPRGLVLPLRLENGKAMLGPVKVANLPPLY